MVGFSKRSMCLVRDPVIFAWVVWMVERPTSPRLSTGVWCNFVWTALDLPGSGSGLSELVLVSALRVQRTSFRTLGAGQKVTETHVRSLRFLRLTNPAENRSAILQPPSRDCFGMLLLGMEVSN